MQLGKSPNITCWSLEMLNKMVPLRLKTKYLRYFGNKIRWSERQELAGDRGTSERSYHVPGARDQATES